MEKSRKRVILREIIWAAVIGIVCMGLLFGVVKNRWTFEFQFKKMPYLVQGYPQDEILIIGSYTMEYWTTSEADLGPLQTVNMAVEGTKVEDWKEHFHDLVEPFHPRAIVLFLGSADIDGSANSKSGKVVAAELAEFFDLIEDELPGTSVYYTLNQ